MGTVAALYVEPRGVYSQIDGVDVYGVHDVNVPGMFDRDAALYAGPHAVVAHPPCGPWGLFAWNYKGGEGGRHLGPLAVQQVRAWGGILEHPKGSQLWKHCDLPKVGELDRYGGTTKQIEQVHWGHPCTKPTWLYCCRVPSFPPMPRRVGEPTHCMVRLRRNSHERPELPKRLRHLTPPALAWWLVAAARRVHA